MPATSEPSGRLEKAGAGIGGGPIESDPGLSRAIPAGIITALVGFTSSFAVVLAGLTAVGATQAQAASGLLSVCVTMGLGTIILARRYRMPITLAWSTPGAAMMAASTGVLGGWPAAVASFCAVGLAVATTAAIPQLSRSVAAIPAPIAQAMLAGVLLSLCLVPVTALAASPAAVAPVILVWLILQRFRPSLATPAAFVTAVVVIVVNLQRNRTGPLHADLAALAPHVEWTAPQPTWQSLVSLAIPLYLVTMASQNLPGAAVMAGLGYRLPWRAGLLMTGVGTLGGAFAGGHAINFAAISAALAADPGTHPDPRRRYPTAITAGVTYLVLAAASVAVVALVAAAPGGLIGAVAGLALLPTLAGALKGAMTDDSHRTPATITFLVAASGVNALAIGSAFWALVAGLVTWWALR